MYTRRVLRSFSANLPLLCCLAALGGCHSSPRATTVPAASGKDQVEVGYGSQRRKDVNGAVAGADADKLMANSPRTVSDMLVGRFAGVEVRRTANGGTSIRIRGARSFKANQEPLLVLDGMPQHNGSQSLSDLDPHDIKSIEVLKDAAATAVYGSRGSNGVILISTKRGS